MAAPADLLVGALVDLIAERVVAKLRAESTGMIDQRVSPLGRKRHCSVVRARLGRGDPGAAIVGRRHLLTPQALEAELAQHSTRPRKPKDPEAEAPANDADLDPYLARYGVARRQQP